MAGRFAYGGGATALASRWWAMVLRGVAAVVFGVLTFFAPRASLFPLAIATWVGAFAVALGVLLVALGLRLRSWGRTTTRATPAGAVPASH